MDILIALAGWIGWNILLWGFAHDEAELKSKAFSWKQYKKANIDDAVVTLFVGVPLVVWKSEWLWGICVNKLPSYFFDSWENLPYDSVGLVFSGPLVQLLYFVVKRVRKVWKSK